MATEQIAARTTPRHIEQPSYSMPTDIAAVRSVVTDLERQARDLIHDRPVLAVLIAAGVGYLMARVVVRGSR
ncbi:MAG: hypothetical protein SH850_04985 [Planctomycetaceae bacterium]|mgnify:CR=1 FL=1|nr:hypothetical protein [Planctomycetaceae bacterium]